MRIRFLVVTDVRGSTTVSPFESGSGCEAIGVSLMRTVSVPCVIATVETSTSWPMTTVPVRSLMTTRAGTSGTTVEFADLGQKARRGDLRRLDQCDAPHVALARHRRPEAQLRRTS